MVHLSLVASLVYKSVSGKLDFSLLEKLFLMAIRSRCYWNQFVGFCKVLQSKIDIFSKKFLRKHFLMNFCNEWWPQRWNQIICTSKVRTWCLPTKIFSCKIQWRRRILCDLSTLSLKGSFSRTWHDNNLGFVFQFNLIASSKPTPWKYESADVLTWYLHHRLFFVIYCGCKYLMTAVQLFDWIYWIYRSPNAFQTSRIKVCLIRWTGSSQVGISGFRTKDWRCEEMEVGTSL